MPRPSEPILSPDKIAEAALELIDSTGEFTIGAVARRLSVRPSSLYNHVDGREEIISLIRDNLIPETIPPFRELPWEQGLSEGIRLYRAILSDHPAVVPLLATVPLASAASARMYEEFAATMHTAGFRDEQILDAITAIDTFALGSALDMAAPPTLWASPHWQTRMRVVTEAAPQGRERADQSFEFGLRVLIDGLRAQLPAH